MKSPLDSILCVSALAFGGACVDSAREETITVDHYKSTCTGLGPLLCMNVDGQLQYDGIVGFQFEWGYRYRLRVKIETIDNPPADASSQRVTLVEQLEKTRVPEGTEFSLRVYGNAYVKPGATTAFSLIDDTSLECEPNATCQAITEGLSMQPACFRMQLGYPPPPATSLLVRGVYPETCP